MKRGRSSTVVIAIDVTANRGAVSEFFRHVSQELSSLGFEVVLWSGQSSIDVDLSDWSISRQIHWKSPRPDNTKSLSDALAGIHRLGPKCVVTNFGHTTALQLAAFANRVPVRVAWARTLMEQITGGHPTPYQRLQIVRRTAVSRCVTNWIANSEATRQDIHAMHRIPLQKISVVHNAIADPLSDSSDLGTRESDGFILCVARAHPSKAQVTLLEAVGLMQHHTRVKFVGSNTDSGTLSREAERLGVVDRCEFLGSQPYQKVHELMETAIVHVLPSRSEAFGLVNIEAMAHGTPAIATRVGGIPEIIQDGYSGILVTPNHPAELAEALDRVVGDESFRSTLSINARRRFLDDFEVTLAAARTAQLLHSWMN